MRKKPDISQDDLELFQQAVKDTKKLINAKVRLKSKQPIIHKPKPSTDDLLSFSFHEDERRAAVQGEEFISYAQAGMPNKSLRKLKKGQYNVDTILDLHGMTVEEAKSAVDECLHKCIHEGLRLILIIHGKGHHSQQTILKNKLNHWLREINVVLAFCSASPIHGSRGAIYVLLKRMTGDVV
jgi:DNA-nicking Smr family endonuclease